MFYVSESFKNSAILDLKKENRRKLLNRRLLKMAAWLCFAIMIGVWLPDKPMFGLPWWTAPLTSFASLIAGCFFIAILADDGHINVRTGELSDKCIKGLAYLEIICTYIAEDILREPAKHFFARSVHELRAVGAQIALKDALRHLRKENDFKKSAEGITLEDVTASKDDFKDLYADLLFVGMIEDLGYGVFFTQAEATIAAESQVQAPN